MRYETRHWHFCRRHPLWRVSEWRAVHCINIRSLLMTTERNNSLVFRLTSNFMSPRTWGIFYKRYSSRELKSCKINVALKQTILIRTCFLSLARSKLRLCSTNHRPRYWSNLPSDWPSTAWTYSESKLRLCSTNHRTRYWSNLPCDWPSTAWAYSEREIKNGIRSGHCSAKNSW